MWSLICDSVIESGSFKIDNFAIGDDIKLGGAIYIFGTVNNEGICLSIVRSYNQRNDWVENSFNLEYAAVLHDNFDIRVEEMCNSDIAHIEDSERIAESGVDHDICVCEFKNSWGDYLIFLKVD